MIDKNDISNSSDKGQNSSGDKVRFDAQMYQAALNFYGLPTNYKRVFTKDVKGRLVATTAERAAKAGLPCWIQANLPANNYPIKKASNESIEIYQNLTLDFEYPPNPGLLRLVATGMRDYMVNREWADYDLPVEDSGAGNHIIAPLAPLNVKDWGGPDVVNRAVARVVDTYLKPEFLRLLQEKDLDGKGIKLEGYDISRIMSVPGTFRPGGTKQNEVGYLANGYLRRWLYPHDISSGNLPQRSESEALADLIKATCAEIIAEDNNPLPRPSNRDAGDARASYTPGLFEVENWIRTYHTERAGNRSDDFYRLATATYLRWGEVACLDHAELIDEIVGGDKGTKYGERAADEMERALKKIGSLPREELLPSAQWSAKSSLKRSMPVPAPTSASTDQGEVTTANSTYDIDEILKGNLPAREFSDMGNARRLVERFGHYFKYVPELGWLSWDGTRWERDTTGKIMEAAKDTVRTIYAEASQRESEDDQKATAKFALQSASKNKLGYMIALAQTEREMVARVDEFDRDPYLLNVKNGTLDLKTGKLRPHHQGDMLTKLAGTYYDPDATCPTWLNFLRTIFKGDRELIDYLRKTIGYSLTGDTSEQCFFLLHGTGRNGKSTLIETIQALLGDYAQASDFNTFLEKDREGGGPRNDIAKLAGARFVSAVEADAGKRLSESVIKQLTGGDKISARFLHREYFEFNPEFKLFLGANHKPRIKGQDNGIWRRTKLIPFEYTVPEGKVDKNLPAKLKAELPGILAWAVEGCLEWQKVGLKEPEKVRLATQDYRDESDPLGEFLSWATVIGKRAAIPYGHLYQLYNEFARAVYPNEKPFSTKAFTEALRERGLVLFNSTTANHTRMIKGLTIKGDLPPVSEYLATLEWHGQPETLTQDPAYWIEEEDEEEDE